MIGSLLRFFFRRRMMRALPGGWFTVVLLSPQARAFARERWARRSSRRNGLPPS